MYSAAAHVVLGPLLLDAESGTFIIEFKNLIVSQITFGCVYVGHMYLFSSAKAKVLDVRIYVGTVFH